MDWQHRQAGPGGLVLPDEVDLAGTGDRAISTPLVAGGNGAEFVLGVALAIAPFRRQAKLVQSFATPFEKHRAVYVAQWQRSAAESEDDPGRPASARPAPGPNTLKVSLAGSGERHPAREIVGGDFLHLVRSGRSSCGRSVVLDSVQAYDASLKQ